MTDIGGNSHKIIEGELQRLREEQAPDDKAVNALIDRWRVQCQGDAETVLARIREVLNVVLSLVAGPWPSDEEWRNLLPHWFVLQSAKASDPTSDDEWRTELQRLPPDKWMTWWRENRHRLPAGSRFAPPPDRWSVEDFVYTFRPEERQWWWWSASIQNPDLIVIDIAAFDLPYGHDNFEWLLRTAGARKTDHGMA